MSAKQLFILNSSFNGIRGCAKCKATFNVNKVWEIKLYFNLN